MEPALAPAEAASRLVYGEVPRMLAFARRHIGEDLTWAADAKAIGREVRGELVAVAVYESFTACDCHVHLASSGRPGWLTRELLVHWFAYPFLQCGLRRITGYVPHDNARALRLDRHMGFREEGRLRQVLPRGADLVVLGMLRSECRFLPRIA